MAISPEAYLINAVLNTRELQVAMAAGLNPDVFHVYRDEWLWIEKYYRKYKRVPTKIAFMRHFPDFTARKVDDTAHFSDEVRKSHARHMIMETLRDVTDMVAEGDVDQALGIMRKATMQAASSIGSIRDTDILTNYDDIYDEVRARKDMYDENGMSGIPTGFATVDERTGGVGRGQSWIVGARLGEGKSWTLLLMATSAVINGYNVQFDALEMSRSEVGMRIHNFMSSSVGKNVFQSISLAQGKDFDIRAYRQFLRDLKGGAKARLHVSDDKRIGAMEIASQVERNKPDILFLDYLTLAKTKGDGGWQDIGAFSKELKIIAGEYKIGMVSAAQLNRGNGLSKEVPGAEALAQADAIGQDADAVLNMKKRSEHIIEFRMAKYRHGASGYRWWVNQDLMLGKMEEVTYNKASDIMAADKDSALLAEENSRS